MKIEIKQKVFKKLVKLREIYKIYDLDDVLNILLEKELRKFKWMNTTRKDH